jgi:uncharacterized protein with GYD domain
VPTFPRSRTGGDKCRRQARSFKKSAAGFLGGLAFSRLRLALAAAHRLAFPQEDSMPMFIMSLGWTDQGIRAVKDAPKRSKAARDLAKKVGVDIKEVYMTSGDSDLLLIVDTPNGDNVAKFALALGALGNVRSRTARAWPEHEFQKLISQLP